MCVPRRNRIIRNKDGGRRRLIRASLAFAAAGAADSGAAISCSLSGGEPADPGFYRECLRKSLRSDYDIDVSPPSHLELMQIAITGTWSSTEKALAKRDGYQDGDQRMSLGKTPSRVLRIGGKSCRPRTRSRA